MLYKKKYDIENIHINTKFFDIFYYQYNKYWRKSSDFSKFKNNIFNFTFQYLNYYYIQIYTSIVLYLKLKNKILNNPINLKKILENKIKNILYYKFKFIYSIQLIELLNKFNIFNNKCNKILDINYSTQSSLIEVIEYLKKTRNINIDNHILILTKYNKSEEIIKNNNINYLKKFNTKILIDNKYINLNFIKTNKNKYDIIKNNIRAFDNINKISYDGEFIESSSTQIYFLIFLFALTHLNKNGIFLLNIGSIMTKPVADILVLGKKYFKEVIPYQSKLKTWQFTGVTVIFKGFKGISKKDLDYLINIAKKLLKNDPTSLEFTINDNVLRKKYGFTKPKNLKYKNIKEFINTPITSSEYDFIREFNEELYMNKSMLLNKLLVYQKKYYNSNDTIKQMEKKVPKEVREKQLIHSIMYCKEFDLQMIPFDKGTFNSEFGKMIINNLYSQHCPISRKLIKTKTKKDLVKLDLIEELNKIRSNYNMAVYSLESRDIPKYMLVKHQLSFYQAQCNNDIVSLKEFISKKYTKYKVTTEWLSLQEILKQFNIINDNLKNIYTFHLNEAPGYFIKSLCYSIQKRKKCIKCFEWNAQTLHPSIDDTFTNEYNLLTVYQDRWKFGKNKDGDITNVSNLKSYKDICKNIKLLTADGSTKNLSDDVSLNKLKLAELAFMFHNLPKCSNFVIRLYIPFDKPLFIDLLYLIYKRYKTVYLYKPLENLYSGQFYLIALNYKGISDSLDKKILRLLSNYNNDTLEKRIFKNDYENSFKHQILNVFKLFTENYVFNIDRQIYYLDNKKYIPNEHYQTIEKIFLKKNKEWADQFLSK